MGIQKIVLNLVLSIERFFLILLPIKQNRIVFISLESNKPILDFKTIYQALDKEKYDVHLCLIKYKKNLFGQFLYFLNCIKQMYYVYTSKLIILNDNNYVVSNFKRKGTNVLQVWHACGAIKKFGNALNRKYAISNYDYVLSTSSYWKKPYSEAFSVDEKNVLNIGMPRTDKLFDENLKKQYCDEIYHKYPQIKNKKVVLYAPTFRGNIYEGFRNVEFDEMKILEALGEDYVIIYKFHPLLGNIQLKDHERIINMNNESTYKLFCVSDFLISDYSSIVFDYMILNKPILFFVPDLEEYMSNVGVYVDVNELGYPVCTNEDEIIKNILSYPTTENIHTKNLNTFIEYQDGKSNQRVIEFIESVM